MAETKLSNIEPAPPGRSPRGWLVAAAAAIVALIVGITIALVSFTGDEVEPATTLAATPTTAAPTPTTQAPTTTASPTTTIDPAIEAEALAAAQEFATTEDIDAAMALVAKDAEVNEYGRIFSDVETIREWKEARLRAWVVEVSDFEANGSTVRFRRLSYQRDGDPEFFYADTVTVIVEDGLITKHTAR